MAAGCAWGVVSALFLGLMDIALGGCRGRPMCRPVGGFRKETCPGGHVGPPLRNDWRRSEGNGNWHEKTRLAQRGGTEPAPYRRMKQTSGGVRLGCCFRQPNFETEFGASVIGIGPYALRGDERAARRGRRALRVVAESRRDCPG